MAKYVRLNEVSFYRFIVLSLGRRLSFVINSGSPVISESQTTKYCLVSGKEEVYMDDIDFKVLPYLKSTEV